MTKGYVTLVTKPSYLAGVLILAFTLRKHGSRYPLLVFYTSSLSESCVSVLQSESSKLNIILSHVEPLLPPGVDNKLLIAERFQDTWTKLRVFQPDLTDFDTICFVDADIMISKNMDSIFDVDLPSGNWIAATHACVCNLDKDPWAPENWTPENCAFTGQKHPYSLSRPSPIPPSTQGHDTHRLLNSGVFVLKPSKETWERMNHMLYTAEKVSSYKFPDQDFLTDFFADRWISLCWQYNALKTMRYWHPDMWDDGSVVALHYIVDKPWASTERNDGTAGYLGKDGETHRWWWKQFDEWIVEVNTEIADAVREVVACKDNDNKMLLKGIGADVQAFANNRSAA